MQLLMEELGIADAVQLLNDEHAEIERALTEIGAVTEAAASCSSAYTAASEQSAAMEPSGSVLDDLVVVPTHLHIGNSMLFFVNELELVFSLSLIFGCELLLLLSLLTG
jgi:iron-sulfur cluster repair protein YtfE (RIC family)